VRGTREHSGAECRLRRRDLLLLGLGLGGGLLGCATLPQAADRRTKKLIEFGWDEPDTAFLRRHIAVMEQSPFDGCVFHLAYKRPDVGQGDFLWETWGRRAFSDADLAPALEDLRATPFRRFTDNFLRFCSVPGDVDWFEDFSAVLANANLVARFARAGRAVGILFDTEQYQSPLFDYRKQREAGVRSWDEYAAQARRRGREVMDAFQRGFPDLRVLLTFAYSVPWWEMQRDSKPLWECEYGLLGPFLDGMVEAASGGVCLVDGYELAYFHNKDTSVFAAVRRIIREGLLPLVADPAAYRRRFSVSFGLFMDYDPAGKAWNGTDGGRNYYTPAEFETSVRAALEAADEYVWIYTQTPRWWSDSGMPVNLPEGYAEALRRARDGAGS
jgi:hypothetical protein